MAAPDPVALRPVGSVELVVGRLKAWWLNKLDNDSVRQWVPHYNAAWLAWAIFAAVIFPPVQTLYDAMGPVAYHLWVYLAIVANALPIIGLKMRHGGSTVQEISEMSDNLLTRDWYGLFFQAAGHAIAHVLLLMFEVSVIITALTYDGPSLYAGMTIFAGFMLWPWCEGTPLLCAQCLRKVQIALRRESEEAV